MNDFQKLLFKYEKMPKNFVEFVDLLDLEKLLRDEELFEFFNKNNAVNKEDLKYLLSKITDQDGLQALEKNSILLESLIDASLLQDVVETYNHISDYKINVPSFLNQLLNNKELLKKLIDSDKLTQEDLRYLLNKIGPWDKWCELSSLSENTSLFKYILNKFVLDNETIKRFNKIIEEDSWCKENNIHNVFDLLEFVETHTYYAIYDDRYEDFRESEWKIAAEDEIDQEVLKLIELNRDVYEFNFDEKQQDELIELIQNSEVAKSRLKEIIDSNLEATYDFESLMQYLKKTERKNLINI